MKRITFDRRVLAVRPTPPSVRFAGLVVLLMVAAGAVAQSSVPRKPKDDAAKRRETGRELFGPSSGEGAANEPGKSDAGWCIVLEVHSGEGALARAQERLAPISIDVGRNDVYLRQTERGAAIVAGRYTAPDSAEARADLAAVRERVVSGKKPFSQAFLAPPPESSDPGKIPELNLEAAKVMFGPKAQYTLQIGVYEAEKRDVAKRAAEEGALRLRRDGELAFYYHGPQRSMVTVGVFHDRDFDASLRPKDAGLIGVQQRYPLNLLNGQYPIIEKRPGQPERPQPSMLVRIP